MAPGGVFESDEFAPNIPQLTRPFKGPKFNKFHREANQNRNPRAKNPGVNAAITDPPPDMRLKPPMRGEVDHRPAGSAVGRNKTYDNFLGSWEKPSNKLSHGDFLKSKAPRY